MRLIISTEIDLREPDVDSGLVTWFDIRIVEGTEEEPEKTIGHARVGRVHLGTALDAGENYYDVLDADSGELEALYSVYFDDDEGDLRDDFREGAGNDLLYISGVDLERDWQGRNIELAVVRRLTDTVCEGCELVVAPYASDAEALNWQRMGFEVSTPGQAEGLVHLPCATRTPRVVETDDYTGFKVVPNPPPGDQTRH